MRTPTNELPKAFHPPSPITISTNKLEPPVFPYARLGALPHFSYALENLLISATTVLASLADTLFTLYVWLPLGLLRSLLDHFVDPLIRLLTNRPPAPELPETRVVVISGASSGIGAGLARAYAGPETILVLLARDERRLNQVAKIARGAGCRAVETHSIDYAHEGAEEAIRQTIQGAHDKYGVIDIVCSVAGTVAFTDDDPHGPVPWGAQTAKRLNTINVSSTYAFILTAWELMKKQRSGKICIISSAVALGGPPQFAVYGAGKANLLSLGQALRALSTPYGIQVTCICPGFIESGMTADMLAAGSLLPASMLADTNQMAARIKGAVEAEQAVAMWPINQVLPNLLVGRLNWLNADIGKWVASKFGVTGEMVS